MAKIKVDIPNPKGVSNKILKNPKLGKFLATTWARELDPFVPARDGNLYTNKTIEPFRITYNEPYAHYQWNGVSKSGKPLNYNKGFHPLACNKWNEKGEKAKGAKVAQEVTNFLKRM